MIIVRLVVHNVYSCMTTNYISIAGQSSGIAIAFKYVKDYTFIWTDSGSGADRDVSFWRPYDVQSGYFPLGDVATASHGKPSIPSLTVTALVADALAPPTSFSEVWNDRGSGADRDVRVMRMNPPSGYTCLGYVAVVGYGTNPDRNRYRYVLYNNYVDDVYYASVLIILCQHEN